MKLVSENVTQLASTSLYIFFQFFHKTLCYLTTHIRSYIMYCIFITQIVDKLCLTLDDFHLSDICCLLKHSSGFGNLTEFATIALHLLLFLGCKQSLKGIYVTHQVVGWYVSLHSSKSAELCALGHVCVCVGVHARTF